MLSRVFFACLFLALDGACAAPRCRWLEQKFGQYSENSLNLLNMMTNNSTNITEEEEQRSVAFPHHLYSQASKASAEAKLAFTVQILLEVSALFEENNSSSSWEEVTAEHFLNVVNTQADKLHSCIGGQTHMKMKKNTKLHSYFRKLSREVLEKMEHSADAWELIRREIKAHLMRVDNLISSLLN